MDKAQATIVKTARTSKLVTAGFTAEEATDWLTKIGDVTEAQFDFMVTLAAKDASYKKEEEDKKAKEKAKAAAAAAVDGAQPDADVSLSSATDDTDNTKAETLRASLSEYIGANCLKNTRQSKK